MLSGEIKDFSDHLEAFSLVLYDGISEDFSIFIFVLDGFA